MSKAQQVPRDTNLIKKLSVQERQVVYYWLEQFGEECFNAARKYNPGDKVIEGKRFSPTYGTFKDFNTGE